MGVFQSIFFTTNTEFFWALLHLAQNRELFEVFASLCHFVSKTGGERGGRKGNCHTELYLSVPTEENAAPMRWEKPSGLMLVPSVLQKGWAVGEQAG